MARISVAVGVSFALIPTALYFLSSHDSLRTQAEAYARGLARPLSRLAAQQPGLWRYNLSKVLIATAAHRDFAEIGSMRIVGCSGETLFDGSSLGLGTQNPSGPAGWAPIEARGRTVAWVEVVSDASGAKRAGLWIALASLAAGAAIGWLLYSFSSGEVHRQAVALHAMADQLAQAERELRATNAVLQQRVAEAVGEVKSLSARLLDIQERERGRIARDLHDSVGQMVTALQIDLQMAESSHGASEKLREARGLAEEILSELRRVVRDLRPLELEVAGLSEALRAACERFEIRTGIPTSFRHVGGEVSENALALCLLRVTQEALTNVSRHAQAEEVGVSLIVDERAVTLEVRDDGVGFSPSTPSLGSGISGMKERVQFAGGTLIVDPAEGRGTLVRATFPR